MQTRFDFKQYFIDAAIHKWHDRLRSCVQASGGHYCETNVHLYDSSEHFLNSQCNLMHLTAILQLT